MLPIAPGGIYRLRAVPIPNRGDMRWWRQLREWLRWWLRPGPFETTLNHTPELALHGDLQIDDETSGRPHHLNLVTGGCGSEGVRLPVGAGLRTALSSGETTDWLVTRYVKVRLAGHEIPGVDYAPCYPPRNRNQGAPTDGTRGHCAAEGPGGTTAANFDNPSPPRLLVD